MAPRFLNSEWSIILQTNERHSICCPASYWKKVVNGFHSLVHLIHDILIHYLPKLVYIYYNLHTYCNSNKKYPMYIYKLKSYGVPCPLPPAPALQWQSRERADDKFRALVGHAQREQKIITNNLLTHLMTKKSKSK